MPQFEGFPKTCIPYLKQLAKNNNREWFNDNKQRYEDCVRNPAMAFIAAMAPQLPALSPHFRAVAKKMGGSLMRVYRDTRFAGDKTPFKTNVGIHFRHELGKDVHAPGFYVHIEPGDCFLGAGIWHPEPPVLNGIREFIIDNPNAWKKATQAASFSKDWALVGDTLVRPPRGIDPAHELMTDLKRKDFIALASLSASEVTGDGLVKLAAQRFAEAAPLMQFLCAAQGVQY